MPQHHLDVALIDETKKVTFKELSRARAVLQKRLRRDLAPIWGVSATIELYRDSRDAPREAWPVTIKDKLQSNALTFHADDKGKPYAQVLYSPDWVLSLSHSLVEMLVDPFGDRFATGPCPQKGHKHDVQFLVEICDPCTTDKYAYEIDGIRVSDFCTPDYYRKKPSGARYSFTNAFSKPFQLLRGGYFTWQEDGNWWQRLWFLGKGKTFSIGPVQSSEGSRRQKVSVQMLMLSQIKRGQQARPRSVQALIEELIRDYAPPSS
jgi:hypothetical protein